MRKSRDTETYLGVLRETAHALSGLLQESKIVETLLEEVGNAIDARGSLLRLLSPDATELLPSGARGLSESYLGKGPVLVARSHLDQRILQGETVVCSDVTCEVGFQYPRAAAMEGLRGMVGVPLTVRDRSIGVLRVYVDDVGALQQEDYLLLSTLADLGALAIEKVRLHQSLYRIAEALNGSLELRAMLESVLEAAVREMGLKGAAVRVLGPDARTMHLMAAYGLSERYLAKGDVHLDSSPVDRRALQGEVVVVYDVEHEPGLAYPEEAASEGIRSVLAVPLKLKDRALGVMRVYSAQPRHFGQVAADFLGSVANLVALAMENAELYAKLQERYEDLKLDLADWHKFLALG